MDITISKEKRFSNQFINGETVNYAIACIASFLSLIVIKQILKTFIGVATAPACGVAFVLAEAIFFLLQKFFVFKKNISTPLAVQVIFAVLSAGMHFGIYRLAVAALQSSLNLFDFTVWFASAVFIFIARSTRST